LTKKRVVTSDETIQCAAWLLRRLIAERHGRLLGQREERVDLADVAYPSVQSGHDFAHEN